MNDHLHSSIENGERNNAEVLADRGERGPGFDSRYKTYILARDPKKKKIYIGGLGGMGVGRMWFDEGEEHAKRPGYEEAPQVDSDDFDTYANL